MTATIAFAEDNPSQNAMIPQKENDELEGTLKLTLLYNDSIFYIYSDKSISYCSQLSASNVIQFSYVLSGTDKICVSKLYCEDEIVSSYRLMKGESNYEALNRTIIENITNFCLQDELIISSQLMTRDVPFATLQDATGSLYGSNYSQNIVGVSQKSYNGVTYWVYCWESQSITNTSPDYTWFAKDTAISALVAFVISGGWSWIGLVVAIIEGVVSTVVVNGITYTVNNFLAGRSDVSIMRDRMVTVDGYSETQYWAGWTRRRYFFLGEDGWTFDSGCHYDSKHSDYDDVIYLMQHGFDNFVNSTLL